MRVILMDMEVLSGFINSVFLVFIEDRLLLVSILGLFVNFVGVFAFRDAHAHSHGDHGHSHEPNHHDSEHHDHHDHHEHHDHHDHNHSHDHHHDHDHHHEHEEHHDQDHEDEEQGESAHNDNVNAIFLHLLADTLGSVAVIVSSVLIHLFGWTIADPICSFCLSFLILMSVIPLLKKSATTLLQRTPQHFEQKLEKCLLQVQAIEGVSGFRDPHFWNHDGNMVVGTLHVQVKNTSNEQEILNRVLNLFKNRGVAQVTVQIERENSQQISSSSLRGAPWI